MCKCVSILKSVVIFLVVIILCFFIVLKKEVLKMTLKLYLSWLTSYLGIQVYLVGTWELVLN